jgi:rRNA-processing protein FCF1
MNNLHNIPNVTPEQVWAFLYENERIFKEKTAELNRKFAETDRLMKELQKQYGGISNSNGEMAEEYFYRAFKRNKTLVNETFDRILRNKCINNGTWEAEFDILLLNGKSVAIIEVKYRANDNITLKKLISRIAPFKALFPDYKNHNIYLGVAAMSFDKHLAKRLHNAGIVTIHQEGKKVVVCDQEMKVF